MAVTAKAFGLFFLSLANREVDFNSDVIKCSLHTATYVPDQDTHQYKSSAGSEVVGTGYTAGGATLTNPTITYTAATNVLMLDADDAVWANSTITLPVNGSAVVYDSTPATDATRPLVCYQTTDTQVASTSGEFRVAWSASGIVQITVS